MVAKFDPVQFAIDGLWIWDGSEKVTAVKVNAMVLPLSVPPPHHGACHIPPAESRKVVAGGANHLRR